MNGNKIISVEGNIGSGKSTFVTILKEKYKDNQNIIFLLEPVDQWKNIVADNGDNIIQRFYKDSAKYSFSFQMVAFISRLSLFKDSIEKNKNKIIVTERSLFTDKYVFAQMLYDDNKMEKINFDIYLKWFYTFSCDYPISEIIYISTNPVVCSERIVKRSRDGESNISIDYLSSCNNYHDSMIDMMKNNNCNITTLDGNINIYKNKEKLYSWLRIFSNIIASSGLKFNISNYSFNCTSSISTGYDGDSDWESEL